jgi:hypothetical protein
MSSIDYRNTIEKFMKIVRIIKLGSFENCSVGGLIFHSTFYIDEWNTKQIN